MHIVNTIDFNKQKHISTLVSLIESYTKITNFSFIHMKPFIPLILGTSRKDNNSEKIAAYLLDTLTQRGDVEVQLVKPEEFISGRTIPSWEEDAKAKNWRDLATRANAFIIITPEYNHGYPGELKMLLDAAYKEYTGKPVVLCGVSAGPFGGVRVVEQLVQVVRELGMKVLSFSLHFPMVKELTSLSKEDLDKQYAERMEKMIDLLLKEIK